ncbi:MAG TPA: HNH endonuclease signature motif containing protein [Blastocatellia bacterium]|jgi:5-methylcytosine-specific restriction endonuclease McrA|nr:HNH endonuclease signature motif containing protein [Blastocatellia bacterium]
MAIVVIEESVEFAPNLGVIVREKALELSPERLHELVALAFQHIGDAVLEAASYYEGPLSGIYEISFEEYLPIAEAYQRSIQIKEATASARRTLIKRRRASYSAQRDALVLALLDKGVPYVCNHEDCGVTEDLTLDHIIALSRGGTDDLSNLQFLCRSHNSQKGAK